MKHTEINIDKAVELVLETKRFFDDYEMTSHIKTKGPADFVTETDMTIQAFLCEQLKEAYPDIQFMGEEKSNAEIDFSGKLWILDPVDGTTNLIHHYNHSAVSLALAENGKITAGIIYCPFTSELFTACKGKKAFLNGKMIQVSAAASLEESLISVGTNPYERKDAVHTFELMKNVFLRCQDIRRSGSAALDLAYVACGRAEAYFEMNLKPWDFAAGLLIVEEAGGSVSDYAGEPLRLDHPSDVMATNGRIRNELMIYLSAV